MQRILLLISFLLYAVTVFAQRFTSKIEQVDGYYRLTYTVTSRDVEDFTPPSLAAFDILSGPSTSSFSSYQMINGKTSHEESTTFTYILSAKQSGNLQIGGATVHVNGKVYRSNAVKLHVEKREQGGGGRHGSSSAQPQTIQRAGSKVSERDLFIDLAPSRTKVREQEAVMLTYRVHSRVGVGLSNTQLANKPDFKNLISHEIPLPGNQIQTTVEHRNGLTYRTGTILQYVVFPQATGEIKIPSITFDCTVVQQDPAIDLLDAYFNGGGRIGLQVSRKIPETTLYVEKLPDPKPADFSGAVGKLTMEGSLLSDKILTNDIATYRLKIKGVGNLKLLTAPTVRFPNDFETYETKTNEDSRVTPAGLEGEVTFDYTFIPRNIGEYTISAVSFSYFDTESGKYETLTTQPVRIKIGKGVRSNADVDKQLALLKSDIHEIQKPEDESFFARLAEWGTAGYRVLQILLLLIFGLFLFFVRKFKSNLFTAGKGAKGAGKRAIEALQALQKKRPAADDSEFYTTVAKIQTAWLTDGYDLPAGRQNKETIIETLTRAGLPADRINDTVRLYEICSAARYAPVVDVDRESVYRLATNCFTVTRSS